MNNKKLILKPFLIISSAVLILTLSCKKDKTIPPTMTTAEVINIGLTTSTSGGEVTSEGSGPVTDRGLCWGTNQEPSITGSHTLDGEGTGSFVSELSNLIPATKYYTRAYATNKVGTAYGNTVSFTTKNGAIDSDGNIYNAITIGTQIWLLENLKTTKYNDGTDIPLVTTTASWINLTTPAYCWYNNDASTYKADYGALYNWYTVNTGKICPIGWHVPIKTEWETLITYVGGVSAIGKLKETGTAHWINPNEGATNESGFTAFGGGYRTSVGAFGQLGQSGIWWAAATNGIYTGFNLFLTNYSSQSVYYDNGKSYGHSVRCLKN